MLELGDNFETKKKQVVVLFRAGYSIQARNPW